MNNTRYAIAAAVAGGLTLAGGTAAVAAATASASTAGASTAGASTAGGTGTAKAGPARPAAPPVLTHVTVYSVDSDAPVFTSVVSGPVAGDHGPAEQVGPGSTVPTVHGGELLLSLSRGTFRLNIADIDTKFTKALGPATIPSTCSDYVSVRDSVPIVPGSGTGVYRGITGTFDATLTVNEIHPTPCTQTVKLFRQLIWFNAAGKITRR
ncbi:MAG: hypothetical protein JO345_41260 [Streptosporangiaceae bacterium]|nr:hypothetical protein [Streptosporangiaceae bacterium]